MFSGSHLVTLDDKGRLAIPACFREMLRSDHSNAVVVTLGLEELNVLQLYLPAAWDQLAKDISILPNTGYISDGKTQSSDEQVKRQRARRYQRAFFATSKKLDIDHNGRILLPQDLRTRINLKKKATLVGQHQRLEIWPEDLWKEEYESWAQDESRLDIPGIENLVV